MPFEQWAKPVKIERGATYVIEIDERLSTAALSNLKQYLDAEVGDMNVRFILLDKGIRLVREPKSLSAWLMGIFRVRQSR